MKKVYVLVLAMISAGAFAQGPDFQKMRDVPQSSGKIESPQAVKTPKKVYSSDEDPSNLSAGKRTFAIAPGFVTVSFSCTGAKIGGAYYNYVRYIPNHTFPQLEVRTEYDLYNDAGENNDDFVLYFNREKSVVESSDPIVGCFVNSIE